MKLCLKGPVRCAAKVSQYPTALRHFGEKAQKQNHEIFRPKVDNITPIWIRISL